LIDIGALKIPYHVNAVVTREKTVKERRAFVGRVVRAFTEALHFIKTNKEETKALIGKNLKTNDPEGLERAYRAYSAAFPEVPYPNAEGVKTLLDDIAPRTPKAATADPKSFVDMSWFRNWKRRGLSSNCIEGESHRLNSECPLFRSRYLGADGDGSICRRDWSGASRLDGGAG